LICRPPKYCSTRRMISIKTQSRALTNCLVTVTNPDNPSVRVLGLYRPQVDGHSDPWAFRDSLDLPGLTCSAPGRGLMGQLTGLSELGQISHHFVPPRTRNSRRHLSQTPVSPGAAEAGIPRGRATSPNSTSRSGRSPSCARTEHFSSVDIHLEKKDAH
jgi:hypothetical protein